MPVLAFATSAGPRNISPPNRRHHSTQQRRQQTHVGWRPVPPRSVCIANWSACKDEQLDFSQVVTFNLDEYFPIAKHSHSYYLFMQEMLFRHVNINPKNTHIPDGEVAKERANSTAAITSS